MTASYLEKIDYFWGDNLPSLCVSHGLRQDGTKKVQYWTFSVLDSCLGLFRTVLGAGACGACSRT